jgi:uncharacterized membrane protein
MMSIHWYDFILIFATIIPILIGLVWVWRDANRRGQPGWLWALLTIPFGWFTIIVYVVVRAL